MASEGRLHIYHPRRHLTLFEYQMRVATNSSTTDPGSVQYTTPRPSTNILLFVGGLYDNFLSPPYVPYLASQPPFSTSSGSALSQWTLMHVQLSSAMTGWGVSNLNRDVEQVATCINYIRDYVIKQNDPDLKLTAKDINIVMMGHSTGCQDVLHYLHSSSSLSSSSSGNDKPTRPSVQGAILQAPVSDREAIIHLTATNPNAKKAYDDVMKMISTTPEDSWDDVILPMDKTLPLHGPTPISITRFLSLASPSSPDTPSLDDLFSSDLTDTRLQATFGTISTSSGGRLQPRHTTPSTHTPSSSSTTSPTTATTNPTSAKPSILILISGSDESMPASIDKPTLLSRWKTAIEHHDSTTAPASAFLDVASGIVEGARHDIGGEDEVATTAQRDMRDRVMAYLDRVLRKTGGNGDEEDLETEKEGEERTKERAEGQIHFQGFKEAVADVWGEGGKRDAEMGKL